MRKPIPRLRWWIGGLLFLSTVINYIDRQTFSVLGPFLQREYHWSNSDFASILIAFRLTYTAMQGLGGRFIDVLGTRLGLSLTVTFYSTVATLTTFAQGLWGFRIFRGLLGAGEGPNWPGATKTVSEWFPDSERAWAVALFDSGSSIGGAVAPFLVLFLYHHFGTWRPVFICTGLLGFAWVILWRVMYRKPEDHPRLSPEELTLIRSGQANVASAAVEAPPSWRELLRYKQAWGIIIGRTLLDPYWFFVSDWFAIFLASKGFGLERSALGFWAPFLAADIGNFFGAALSSFWIRRGWAVGRSRRTVLLLFGPGMLLLIPAAFTTSYALSIGLFAWSTFAYAACATMFLSLPADVFPSRAVASISGLSGTGAGLGTLLSTWLIGHYSDRLSFQPVVIVASLIPCLATLVFVTMVRAPRKPDPNGIVLDF
ncbi:MAG TPA: MFS transporter [Bryobacteraceae bacterium]|nr:MFS transporter [Bryobacteraceae bacterium]